MKEYKEFLNYLENWMQSLKILSAGDVLAQPNKTAIISADVINGFCKFGPLASQRVATIIDPIVKLFKTSWEAGCHNIVLMQDTHEPNAVEFDSFPPHCIRGTAEAEAVDEFKKLPFFDQMIIIKKNSINSGLNTELDQWIAKHPQVNTFIAVGDCTDLCVYQLAMHLRLSANATQRNWHVIVPEDCVETYSSTVESAKEIGAFPHPGNLLHYLFLYHMALNGIELVKSIT